MTNLLWRTDRISAHMIWEKINACKCLQETCIKVGQNCDSDNYDIKVFPTLIFKII